MTSYFHKVQYYETDKMGVTHHSNYIRFMEEARTDYLEKMGYGYDKMESLGLVSPVVSVNMNFKKSTTYSDEIEIVTKIAEVSPVKTTFSYEMKCGGDVVCTATSVHCFVDKSGRPLALKRVNPELYDLLLSRVEA